MQARLQSSSGQTGSQNDGVVDVKYMTLTMETKTAEVNVCRRGFNSSRGQTGSQNDGVVDVYEI